MVSGFALMLLGVLAVAHLSIAAMTSTFVIAATMFLGSILLFGHAFAMQHTVTDSLWFWSGASYMLAAVVILFEPMLGTRAIYLPFALLLAISGVPRLVIGIRQGVASILYSGATTILVGAIIMMDWPQNSLWIIGLLVAADLLAQGVTLATTGARNMPGR